MRGAVGVNPHVVPQRRAHVRARLRIQVKRWITETTVVIALANVVPSARQRAPVLETFIQRVVLALAVARVTTRVIDDLFAGAPAVKTR